MIMITRSLLRVILWCLFAKCTLCYDPTPPVANSTTYGTLYKLKGTDTFALYLTGNSEQRGRAHGQLLATQIIDFIEFYLFRTCLGNNIDNYNNYTSFVSSHLSFPTQYSDEMENILQGMKESGKSLIIPSLNRTINIYDIMAANAYLEQTARIAGPFLIADSNSNVNKSKINSKVNKAGPSCTQFLATLDMTYDHHMLTARNMDGECDEWKVTVTHLIIFAIEATPTTPRIISFMWPGFVGTESGINELGVYTMMNTGNMGDYGVIGDITPVSIQMRSILDSFSNTNFSSDSVLKHVINNFASSESLSKQGTSGGGAIIMTGCPVNYNETNYNITNKNSNIFALEMDRENTIVRLPGDSPDLTYNTAIMATNHFRKLGVNLTSVNDNPVCNAEYLVYDMDVRTEYFNSSWRYESGRSKLNAINRTKGYLDEDSMMDLLKSVSHGSTEHSIVIHALNVIDIYFAVANKDDTLWDAPYQNWHHFVFEDLFVSK